MPQANIISVAPAVPPFVPVISRLSNFITLLWLRLYTLYITHSFIWRPKKNAVGSGTAYSNPSAIQLDNVTPSGSGRLHNIVMLGWLRKTEHDSDRVDAILRALPTPPKQQGINFWEKNPETGRYDLIWTKENGDPYGEGEIRPPTFKCNEWTALHAIPALRTAGILCD